jgi:hypothetical protein
LILALHLCLLSLIALPLLAPSCARARHSAFGPLTLVVRSFVASIPPAPAPLTIRGKRRRSPKDAKQNQT